MNKQTKLDQPIHRRRMPLSRILKPKSILLVSGCVVLLALTIAISTALAQSYRVVLAGGDSVKITCEGRGLRLNHVSSRSKLTLSCAPRRTWSPPTDEPPEPTHEPPTLEPSPVPTDESPAPEPSPSPTNVPPTPEPSPTDEPPQPTLPPPDPGDNPPTPTSIPGGNSQSGQIVVDSSNPAWLFYNRDANNDGQLDPLFIAGPGDPEDFLYRGSRNGDGTRNGDQMAIINKLAGTGANSIYMQAIRSHGGDGSSDHNPFVNANPAQGLDEDILNQWESWFTAMDDAGIVIYFFFYDDSACIWACGSHTVPTEERLFLQALVNRFEHHEHLIWVIAEEYSESFSRQRAANMAAVIRQADDRAHPIALHQVNGLTFDLPDDPNIDQFAIQYNVGGHALHNGMVTAWNSANGRYNLNMSESSEHGTGATARKNSWRAAMGGAYVMVLRMDVINTPSRDLEDLGRLRAFFENTNFYEMAPHDELAFGGTEYVLARPGDSYIAYASASSGDIGLREMSAGVYDITWLDTATGAVVNQSNVNIDSGNQSWSKPVGLGNEVAVYIRLSN